MTRNRRSSEACEPVASTSAARVGNAASGSEGSDSDSGGISDGDPPGYVAPAVAVAGPPAVVVAGSMSRSASTESGTKDKGKRTYEELEEITFSNPKQFTSMAFDIAA